MNEHRTESSRGMEVVSETTIRGHFPALERQHGGRPVAYFDGPGGTQVPRMVVDAMVDYLFHHNANTHWQYPASAETDAALWNGREMFAALLNGTPREIVFGTNMTTLTFHVSRALGRRIRPGDELVVTELDHHANIAPWTALGKERDAVVRWGRLVPETGQLDMEHVLSLIGDRTKVVAIGAAANALGTVTDLGPVIQAAHAVGALVFVDGVHYVPHQLADVRALGCDLFACSPYKFYGPHVGVLWGREALLLDIDFPKLLPASNDPPERAETGTLCHEGIVGAAAGVEWLASLAGRDGTVRQRLAAAYGTLHARGRALFARLWDGLGAIGGVRRFGPSPTEPRTPTAAFVVRGVPADEVSRHLATHGLFTSHGDFYAMTVVERLGLAPAGLVRAGCSCYTTEHEIDRLVEGVAELASS